MKFNTPLVQPLSSSLSITTFPDENKQNFKINAKKILYSNHVFALNINKRTDKIAIVFRKKTILTENPIIASSTIHLKNFVELPIKEITNDPINTGVQTLDIYYPLQKQIKEEKDSGHKQFKRKVLGQMEVQLSFTTPYLDSVENKDNTHINKATKKNEHHKEGNHIIKMKQKKNADYKQIDDDACYLNFV